MADRARVLISLGSNIDPEHNIREALRILQDRRKRLATQLKAARETLIEARTASKNPDRYRLALMEHAMQSTEADIAWLDGLVASERQSASLT